MKVYNLKHLVKTRSLRQDDIKSFIKTHSCKVMVFFADPRSDKKVKDLYLTATPSLVEQVAKWNTFRHLKGLKPIKHTYRKVREAQE